jgi:hypothetical protein
MPQDKLPIKDFAARIKAKYPEYANVADDVLVQKIVAKYPEYEAQVDLSPLKKKEPQPSPKPGAPLNAGGPAIFPSTSTSTSPSGLPLFGAPKTQPQDKIGQQVQKSEEKRRLESFADVEGVFREAVDAQSAVAPENQVSIPMGTASSQEWQAEMRQRNEANLQLAHQKKEALLKQKAPQLYAPIKELVSSGKYKNFFDAAGNFKTGAAIEYFDKVVKEKGGGSFTRDMLVATLRKEGENLVDGETKEALRRASDKGIKSVGQSGLLGKSLASGWYRGLSMLGNHLASKGYDNSLTRYMQGKDYEAEQLAPGQYKWNDKEWLDRATTSAGTSLGASLPTMLPAAAITIGTGGAGGVAVGGTLGFLGERAMNSGGIYDEVLKQTGDPALAREKADEFSRKQAVTLPLYYLDALTKIKAFGPTKDMMGNVVKSTSGLKNLAYVGSEKALVGSLDFGQETVTEFWQGYTEAQAAQDYQGSFGQYVNENSDTVGDVLAAQVGSNVGFAAAGKIYRTLGSKTPAAKKQFWTEVVGKEGPEVANQIIDQQVQAGAITEEEAQVEKEEVAQVAQQVEALKPLGVQGEDAKAYLALSEELQGLQAQMGETEDPTVLSALKIKAEEVEADLRAIVSGQGAYVKVTYPGGARQTAVLPIPHFRRLQRSGEADELIQSAESLEVVGDEALNDEVQQKKGEIGNAEGAPEGFYENTHVFPQPPAPTPTPRRVEEEERGEMQGEKIKVFRGTGRNVASGENSAVQWVAEDRRVAENYAEDGQVEELEIERPKNPFEMPSNNIHVRGKDVGNRLRTERDKLFKAKKISREQAVEIGEAISKFEEAAGDDLELYSTKTNKQGAAEAFVNALKLMGFDGLVQMEAHDSASPFTNTKTGNESITYGIFKEPAQPTDVSPQSTAPISPSKEEGSEGERGEMQVGKSEWPDYTPPKVTEEEIQEFKKKSYQEKKQSVDTSTKFTDVKDMQVGDYVAVKNDSGNVYEGFVTKIGPKNISVEGSSMYGVSETQFKKANVQAFYKQKHKSWREEVEGEEGRKAMADYHATDWDSVKKVTPEQNGLVNKVVRISAILRAIADGSTSEKELSDVLEHAVGMPEESNIVWAVLHNPKGKGLLQKAKSLPFADLNTRHNIESLEGKSPISPSQKESSERGEMQVDSEVDREALTKELEHQKRMLVKWNHDAAEAKAYLDEHEMHPFADKMGYNRKKLAQAKKFAKEHKTRIAEIEEQLNPTPKEEPPTVKLIKDFGKRVHVEYADGSREVITKEKYEALLSGETLGEQSPKSESPISPSQKETFREAILSALESANGSEFSEVISDIALQDSDRKTAVKNIRKGKKTVATKKVEEAIEKMWEDGYVYLNRGRGDHAESFQMPIEEFLSRISETSEAFADLQAQARNLQQAHDVLGEDLFSDAEAVIEEVKGEMQSESKPLFDINGQTTFYHASANPRVGRLRMGTAPGFGTGVYFSTNRDRVGKEFGDNVTEVELAIGNPVRTSTREWYAVQRRAIQMADEAYAKRKGLKPEDIDEDLGYYKYDPDDDANFYEIDANHVSDAAKEMGYDAIIEGGTNVYGNEIVVLDESKIIYPEDKTNISPQNTENELQTKSLTTENTVPPQGPADTGNEEAGNAGSPPTDATGGKSDPEKVVLSHGGLQDVADELGLEDVQKRTPKSDKDLRQEAEEKMQEWLAAGTYTREIENLVQMAESARVLTDTERVIMEQHLANLIGEARKVRESDPGAYDDKLVEIRRVKRAGEITRSAAGAALRIPFEAGSVPRTVEDAMVDRMESAGVDVLTEEQKRDVEAKFAAYEEALTNEKAKVTELEAANKRLQAEAEVRAARKERGSKPRASRQKDYKKERQSIKESIKEKWQKASRGDGTLTAVPVPYAAQLVAIAPDVAKLMKSYVEEGVTTLADIVTRIHQDVREVVPDVTEDDIRDVIAGAYNEPRPTKSDLLQQVQDLRTEAKLLGELEALENGEIPQNPKRQVKRNRRIKELRDQIQAFKKDNNLGQYAPDAKERAAINALKRGVADLEAKIKEGDIEIEQHKGSDTPAIRALRARQKALRDQLEAKRKEAGIGKYAGDYQLRKIKERNEAKLKELQAKLAAGDFSTKPRPKGALENPELKAKFPELYEQTVRALSEVERTRHELALANAREEMARRPKIEKVMSKVGKTLRTLKATMAGIDMSALGVQNLPAILANPRVGWKAFRGSLTDMGSAAHFEAELARIHASEYWPLIEQSGLSIIDPKSLRQAEHNDLFNNTFYDDLNITRGGRKVNISPTKPFERQFTSLGNYIRINLFLRRAEKLLERGKTFENSPESFKTIASIVNNMTGRGSGGEWFEKNRQALSTVFWSPGLMSSSFNLLGISDVALLFAGKKGFYGKILTSDQKLWAAGQIGRAISTGIVIMMAWAWADDEAEIDWDPTSVTFGYVKSGDYSWSIFGRFTKPVRYIVMRLTGIKNTPSGEVELDESPFGATMGQELYRGVSGYFNPVFGTGVNIAKGTDFSGRPTTAVNEISKMLYPMSFGEFYKGYQADGVGGVLKKGVPSFGGIRVTHKQDFYRPMEAPRKVRHNGADVDLSEGLQKQFTKQLQASEATKLPALLQTPQYKGASVAERMEMERWLRKTVKDTELKRLKEARPDLFPEKSDEQAEMEALQEEQRSELKALLFGDDE